MNRHLYYLLNTYDNDWLKQSAKRCMQARNAAYPERTVDWSSRDKSWCVELRKAAARLLASGPTLIRASKTAIVAEAGVNAMHAAVAARLPLCQAVLDEISESVEQFQLRRLEDVARKLVSDGTPVVRWRLLHGTGIPDSKVTAKLAAAIERLRKLTH
jgi:hypothetical protein